MSNNPLSRLTWKWPILLLIIGLALFAGWRVIGEQMTKSESILSFDECVAAGNPVLETYPEQCIANGQIFTNTPGN